MSENEFPVSEDTMTLLAMVESFKPMFETAKTIKGMVLAEGFDAETAELVSREFLVGCVRKALA